MKTTPYIYIYFFLLIIPQIVLSQNNNTPIIIGSNKKENLLLKQLEIPSQKSGDSLNVKFFNKILQKINSLGYINASLDSVYSIDSITYIKYTLHQPIDLVILQTTDALFISKKFDVNIDENNNLVLPFRELNRFMASLTTYYQNNGYPFMKGQLKNIKTKGNKLYTDLVVYTDKPRKIDRIIVKGYKKFPLVFLQHNLTYRIGDPFDKRKIASLSQIIQYLPFVSEIKKPEILFTKDSTALFLYLKREKSNYFDGIVGLTSSEQTQKLLVTGFLKLKLENSLNYGETLAFNWLSDGKKSQSLHIGLKTPYLLKTPLSMHYNLDLYKKDSSYVTISNLLTFTYKITTYQDFGITISSKKSNIIIPVNTNTLSNFEGFFYGFSYKNIKPDSHPIFKRKYYIENTVLQGKRNKLQQYQLNNKMGIFLKLRNNKILSIRSETQLLFSKEYIVNELYKLGGSNSLRGFDEQSFISDKYSYVNIDYNYLIDTHSFLNLLTDIGVINNTIDKSVFTAYSFGIGYTSRTKIGMLGIEYAIGNTDISPFSFANSKLHLKITQFF